MPSVLTASFAAKSVELSAGTVDGWGWRAKGVLTEGILSSDSTSDFTDTDRKES